MLMPVGSNADRPSSMGYTDVTGMTRFNTTSNFLEFFNGSEWVKCGNTFTLIQSQDFNGDGVTTDFTGLNQATSTAGVVVSINGIVQNPGTAYNVTVDGTTGQMTTLSFTEAPMDGDLIEARILVTTQNIVSIASARGYVQFNVDDNGAYVYTGTTSTKKLVAWTNAGAEVNYAANVTVATAGVATTLDSFAAGTYSSAEYTITGTISGTNTREIAKVLVVTDGSSAYNTVYGVVSTSGSFLTTYTTSIVGGNVELHVIAANANMVYRVKKNYQAI
jgi:hypothetical protein